MGANSTTNKMGATSTTNYENNDDDNNHDNNKNINSLRKYQCSKCKNDVKSLINISKKCSHEPSYCQQCVMEDIKTRINKYGEFHFKCMKCDIELESKEYISLLDDKEATMVEDMLLKEMLETSKELRYCKNPNGCGASQFASNFDIHCGCYKCHACNFELCFKHDMPWHTGFTCKEYDEELKKNEEMATAKLIAEFVKQCPKCKMNISKLDGCDVMTCCQFGTHGCQTRRKEFQKCNHSDCGDSYVFCGTIFCWRCLGIIEENKLGGYERHCKPNCSYFEL